MKTVTLHAKDNCQLCGGIGRVDGIPCECIMVQIPDPPPAETDFKILPANLKDQPKEKHANHK